MNRSFISSSEEQTLPGHRLIRFRPRILSRGFAALAMMLLATELVLRIPAVQAAMPIRTHFHEPGVVVRLQTLERLKRQFDRVDVLFIGSSVVRCNIRPLLFDDVLARRGYRNIVSFNAGMSGLWPQAVRLYAEQLWLPRARPRAVVQGIRYGELVPSTRARKYDAIVTSPVESAWQESGPLARVRAEAFERIHLLQYRGVWPAWLQRYERGRSEAPDDDEVRVFTDPRGWTPRLPTLDVVRAKMLLKDEKPNPALTDQRECADALDAIRRTARGARAAGAGYLLVNMPEHAFRWSGRDGRERYARYLAALRSLAEAEGFPFVDVTDGDPERFANDADYSDYHHMSPDGAARFTMLLANRFDPSIAGLAPPSQRAIAVAAR
jgi:hypothetical protein